MHVLGLIGKAAKRIPKNCRSFPRLYDAQIDLLVVQPLIFLTLGGGRPHEDRACHPACRRISGEVGCGLIDLPRCGGSTVNIPGDDGLPLNWEVVQKLRLDPR